MDKKDFCETLVEYLLYSLVAILILIAMIIFPAYFDTGA
jgi:hypothetical protein